jgi:hypothetical protein
MVVALAVGLLAATGAFAKKSDLQKEIEDILAQNGTTQIGSMSVADVQKILGEISVARQKDAYVQRARAASFMVPGVGQFMGGDPVGGSLFLAGDVALFAGTVLGAYFLLPANVQFGTGAGTGAGGLDYLGTPLIGIKNAWEANSLMSYLPSVGVMVGGMVLKHLFGWWSSKSAAALARQNIADGKVTFEPDLLPYWGHGGPGFGPGWGMMMRWRY